MMEFSSVGPIKQVFIMTALEEYSKQILADKSKWPDNSMISQEAWKAAAQETLDDLKAHFGS
jgi:hypothetical protein